MPAPTEITVAQLSRLVGVPNAPALIDVRLSSDFEAAARLIPGSMRRAHTDVGSWAGAYAGQSIVVICQKGLKLSHGTAALLRASGINAEVLAGGYDAWIAGGGTTVDTAQLPAGAVEGGSVWVTRARPKIDRIACPWLIRRFIDPRATFLFVPPSEVLAVADRFGATPFDIDGVTWSHSGASCTFDVMIEAFGLTTPPLATVATIVRAADTARLDLAPQAAGLLAVSLGLSRMYRDDLAQLDAGIVVYDALYRWARDATEETHDWPTPTGRR